MSGPKFLQSNYGQTVQAFPLTTLDKCNVTTGTLSEVNIIHCVAAGTLTVTFPDGTGPASILMDDGQDFAFPGGATVTVSSGTFHWA